MHQRIQPTPSNAEPSVSPRAHSHSRLLFAFCREQLTRLTLHSEMAQQLTDAIRNEDLMYLGKLEQDLVYGEADKKEVVAYLQKRPRMSDADKVSSRWKWT